MPTSKKKPTTKHTTARAKDLEPKKSAKGGGLLLPAVQKIRG
jgi:hypothetical protein